MRAFIAVMLLGLVGCKTTAEKTPDAEVAAPQPELLLSLKRTPCFGRCPVYTVELFTDGRLHFVGESNTRERGEREGRLSAEELAKVAARIEQSDFAQWKTKYMNHQVTDMPGVVLTWKSKTIEHYSGDESAPSNLTALETDLDVLLGTAKWVRGEEAADR